MTRNADVEETRLFHHRVIWTEQPVEICDESLTVQYVNKAYESHTGHARSEVIGTKSSEMRRKSLQACTYRAKDAEVDRRPSTDWHCFQIPGSSLR
ncbi:unnamed protein product [Dracunculus medinensis]|uniref:PAS_4 domain-containing protein n=1 Tax=Dracunculus medinensis TaxID=318479 RepID=A0A0N4UFG9_DRAME|nr:unnamed protein product [Dracunculus medinensis]